MLLRSGSNGSMRFARFKATASRFNAAAQRFKWFNALREVQSDCVAVQNSPLGPAGTLA